MVVNVNKHGVFAELEPGITGLAHASSLPADFARIDAIDVGEEVEVEIAGVDSAKQKIKLFIVSPNMKPGKAKANSPRRRR